MNISLELELKSKKEVAVLPKAWVQATKKFGKYSIIMLQLYTLDIYIHLLYIQIYIQTALALKSYQLL